MIFSTVEKKKSVKSLILKIGTENELCIRKKPDHILLLSKIHELAILNVVDFLEL